MRANFGARAARQPGTEAGAKARPDTQRLGRMATREPLNATRFRRLHNKPRRARFGTTPTFVLKLQLKRALLSRLVREP